MNPSSPREAAAAHRRVRESLGSWVLGSLEGAGRREVEDHVHGCASCTAEVASLSVLPGLLDRVTDEEATRGRLLPGPASDAGLDHALGVEQARLRRHLGWWRVGALATTALLVVAVVAGIALRQSPAPPATADRLVAAVRPVVADADATRGEAAALAWEWGTTVELDLQALPARDAYVLWAVSRSGSREQAGTWGATTDRGARVRGASSIPRQDLDRVEVTDDRGTVLLTFTFPGD